MLSLDRGGTIYVARRQDKAGIWQQSGADWLLMLDLVAASERVLPTERIAPEIKPDAQGFRNISEEPIAQLAVEPSSALALWSTRGHAIVSARWDRPQSFLHVTAEAEIEDLALSAGGTVGAALEGRRKVHLIRPLKAGSSATGPLLLDQDARSIALSPDGQYLAVGAENGTLIMYNLEHPKRPRSHGAFWTEPYRR
jgi:hypothetical protein